MSLEELRVVAVRVQISVVVYMFKYPVRTALAVGLSMAQIGEFAFVLLSVASQLGLLPYQVYMLLMGERRTFVPSHPARMHAHAPGMCPCMLFDRWKGSYSNDAVLLPRTPWARLVQIFSMHDDSTERCQVQACYKVRQWGPPVYISPRRTLRGASVCLLCCACRHHGAVAAGHALPHAGQLAHTG